MPTGTVKWFRDDKGFGFITEDETDLDYFVHYQNIAGDPESFRKLATGERVEFEKKEAPKGWMAVDVRRI